MCIYVLSTHLVRGTTNKSNSEISGDDGKKSRYGSKHTTNQIIKTRTRDIYEKKTKHCLKRK